jgi:hypothetical protein
MVLDVRRFVAVALLAGALTWSVSAVVATADQTVTPIEPPVEQRVEGVAGPAEQRVEDLSAEQAQQAINGTTPKSGAQRAASTVGKVTLVIMATVVSIATMAAGLLFF